MRVLALFAMTFALSGAGPVESALRAQEKEPGAITVPEKVKKNLGDRAVDILAGATKVDMSSG